MSQKSLNRAIYERIKHPTVAVSEFSKSVRLAFIESQRSYNDSMISRNNDEGVNYTISVSSKAKRFRKKYREHFIRVSGSNKSMQPTAKASAD